MSKILKNTTGSDIELVSLGGIVVPASGQVTLEVTEFLDVASDKAITELVTLINSGDIVVNDGVIDITVANGRSLLRALDFLRYPDTCFNIRFLSDPERNNGFVSKNAQEAIEENKTSFAGKGFQTTFAGNGIVKNAWLNQEDTNVESDQSPDVFKYNARLVGIDFTNQNENTSVDVLIAIKDNPVTTLTGIDRSFKWTLRNTRSAFKTDQVNGFVINPGDLMAVYFVDAGGDPNDVVMTMDFIIISAPAIESQFDYTNFFSFADFPAIASIPEIFTP